MNRSRLALTIVAAVAACLPLSAVAAPTAYYNPATGGIHLKNDVGVKLGRVTIYSESLPNVISSDPSLYAAIPGASLDFFDLDQQFIGFTYLSFPDTGIAPFGTFIGEVILPGTPTTAIQGVWGELLWDGPLPKVAIVEIPEPAGLVLAALTPMLLLLRRRLRSARQSNQKKIA